MGSEDKAFTEFLQAYDERQRKQSGRAQLEVASVERKRQVLEPIRAFLDKFVLMELVVPDANIGEPGVAANAEKTFSFYESESSPSWGPGVSLYFDHPAEVEIAVPNDVDKAKHGAVVIRTVTNHKDRRILDQKFDTVEKAKNALAQFLGKNALAVRNDPRKRRSASGKPNEAVLKSAPEEPPREERGGE